MKDRPIGVTILAVLAGVAAVLAGVRALQFLGIIPFFFGPVPFRTFSFFAFLMWALLVWVYIWLVQMLWKVDPQAWLFLVVITTFYLILDFVQLVGGATMADVGYSMVLNAVILAYCMLPGVKKAFDT